MKQLVFITAGLLCAAALAAGCQPVAAPTIGLLYLDVKGPVTATEGTGTREGRACAQSILGLFSTGDASIEAAKAAGGIQEVSSVDHHSTSILGIVGEFCTIARGK